MPVRLTAGDKRTRHTNVACPSSSRRKTSTYSLAFCYCRLGSAWSDMCQHRFDRSRAAVPLQNGARTLARWYAHQTVATVLSTFWLRCPPAVLAQLWLHAHVLRTIPCGKCTASGRRRAWTLTARIGPRFVRFWTSSLAALTSHMRLGSYPRTTFRAPAGQAPLMTQCSYLLRT